MPVGMLRSYQQALPELIAEYKLVQADAISFPHMTDEGRNQALRTWRRQARYEDAVQKLTPDQAAAKLALVGIGVKRVPRQGVN